jgi:spermidine synthase
MPPRLVLALAYLISGAAGLLYEVAWLRVLSLATGRTEAAVSTLLAAFLGGLAGGAALGGRLVPASPRLALRGYAVLELGVALWALLVPALPRLVEPLLVHAYADGTGGLLFAITRGTLTGLFVAVPALALGATFPFAVRAGQGLPPRPLGPTGLYVANTAGATAGAAGTGFFLLPALGLWRTTLAGVALNAAAAGTALWLSRRLPAHPPDPHRAHDEAGRAAGRGSPGQGGTRSGRNDIATPPQAGAAPARGHTHRAKSRGSGSPAPDLLAPVTAAPPAFALLVPVAVSGFVSLGLEVVWTRLLALILGPTTWAFALMLTVFIGGLALGAGAGTLLAARHAARPSWLAVALLLGAMASLGTSRVVDALALRVAASAARPDATLAGVIGSQVASIALALVPLTLTLGAVFPIGLALARRTSAALPSAVGRLYAVNTLAAIGGALIVGFVLLPGAGLRRSLVVLAAISTIGGVLALLHGRPGRATVGIALALAAGVAGLAVALPPFDPRLLSSGAYKYASYLHQTDVESSLSAGRLLYYADGAGATVSVRRVAGSTSLAIDGKIDASDTGDMLTQRLLAHVPLLLHREARDVMVIGLGSGVTPGSALRHPIARLDVLEISPEVVEASRFFEHVNHRPLADRRTRLVVGDGRLHLQLTRQLYDVVISEPSNPWMAGMAALFTREFFEIARRRLRPGGVMCQWAHTYDMGEADLRSIVATFAATFPHVLLWQVGEGDLLLVGSDASLEPRLETAARGWTPEVAADLASVGIERPFGLLSLVAGGTEVARALAAGAAEQRDDRQALEFSAPRFIVGRAPEDPGALIRRTAERIGLPRVVREAIDQADAGDWLVRARTLLGSEAFGLALDAAVRALAARPDDLEAVEVLQRAAGATGRISDAVRALEAAAGRAPAAIAPRIGLSRFAAATGNLDEGVRLAREAIAVAGGRPEPWEQLASVLADAGHAAALEPVVRVLTQRFPERPLTAYFEGTLAFMRGEFEAASAAAARALARGGPAARVQNLLGAARASLGDHEAARAAFAAAAAADPADPTSLLNLARLERSLANLDRARELYAEALVVAPRSPEALRGLADVLDAQGDPARAARVRALVPTS